LQPQHLQSVLAAVKISQAEVQGAYVNSGEVVFSPGPVKAGKYLFDVGTAGSTSLVLQTIYLPLSLAAGSSQVTLRGGTHVPHSPCYHYLELNWLPHLLLMGCRGALQLDQAGFYPRGGGQIQANILPVKGKLAPLERLERGALKRIRGLSAAANLEAEIAKRQKLQALRRLEAAQRDAKIQVIDLPSPVQGTFIALLAESEQAQACFCALGERGKRAERVADEAVDALQSYLQTGAALDPHLADQLLLPMALASGPSSFTTSAVTGHLVTNAAIIRRFIPTIIEIEGEVGLPGRVRVVPG
jgi:RNA 3'-terminal phosphate cyclase (ATP)